MTECPSEDTLKSILKDNCDSPADDELIGHLGTCDVCKELLAKLSVDDQDLRNNWASVFESENLKWPTEIPSHQLRTQLEPAPTGDSIRDPQSETLPDSTDKLSRPVQTSSANVQGRVEFADYQVIEKLGSGGMGVVYLAMQQSANRVVALKIIRPEQLASLSAARRQTWLDRFRSEAQAAARLEHDHIVRVYEVGEFRGTLFYSMQYIEGQTLSDFIRNDPIENRRLAKLMHSVALAVDYAHQQGILHRDLKPHNILVRNSKTDVSAESTFDNFAGASSFEDDRQERAYVADFGLAKNLVDPDNESTRTGEAIGTPSYMSPEQAQDASRCTPASDIYSLGATLYDASTGRPPFRSASPVETLRQVIDEQPVPPRELNPAIELDLQTITLKALEKDPSRRYASARLLADDLARYIRGEPIEARPISSPERLMRWCRRNPTIAMLTGGVAALLVIVAVESLVSSARLNRFAERESMARKEAEAHFVMSLDVIHEMLTEFGDESLAQVPQMETARKELLQKALALYSDLSASKPTNLDLRIQFARTQYRIGNLYDLLGEHERARDAYAESIEMLDDLANESPDDVQLRYFWANAQSMLGETLRKTSPMEARLHLNRAIETHGELLRRYPSRPDYKSELSRGLNNLGVLLTDLGEYDLAEQRLIRAIDLLRELTETDEADDKDLATYFADLGRAQINFGVLFRKVPERASESERAYRNAIRNLRHAFTLDPANRDYQFRIAVATIDLANVLLSQSGDGPTRAIELAEDALQQFSTLCNEFPGIPVYRYEHANACNTAAVILATSNQFKRATQQFEAAVQVLDKLNEELPTFSKSDARFSSLRGRVLGGLGYVRSLDGQLDDAKRLVERAIENQQVAVGLHPDNPEYSQFLEQHRQFRKQVLGKLENRMNEK